MIEENEGLAGSNLEMVLDAYFESFNKALINNLITKWQTNSDGIFDEDGLVSAFIVLHKTVHSSIAEYEVFLQETFGDNTEKLNSLRRMCAQTNHAFNEDDKDFAHCRRLYGITPDTEIKRMIGEYYLNQTVNFLQEKSREIKISMSLEQDPYQGALIELGIINPEVDELFSTIEQIAESDNDNIPSSTFTTQTNSARQLKPIDSRSSSHDSLSS